ncbi:MAG: hypothetical protein K2J00_07035 [Bacteroidaceae bacterium]|nr:hypothetical protein [Bacteroidaceae bacterium]
MFIKTGDNLRNENVTGFAVNGNRLFLMRDGLDVMESEERYQEQIEFKKIE